MFICLNHHLVLLSLIQQVLNQPNEQAVGSSLKELEA